MANYKKRIILIIVVTLTAISFTVALAAGYFSKKEKVIKENSLTYIYDEGVYIPEPENKDIVIPDDVYWEPMIGCYVSNELKYNPETRTFEEVLDEVPEQLPGEDLREAYWWENGFDRNNDVHMSIKNMYDNWVYSEKMQTILDQEAFQEYIIPLGAAGIDELLVLSIDENIFNKVSLSAIGVIGGINCTDWASLGIDSVAMDDNPYHHEIWKINFKTLMKDINNKEIDIYAIDKYGLFILPYLRSTYEENKETVYQIIKNKFNINSKMGLITNETTEGFFNKNEDVINMIEDVVKKYGTPVVIF